MKLLTKAIEKALPPLYANDGKDPADVPVVVKFFGGGAASWYATEYDPKDKLFFGFVTLGDPMNAELGYFSLEELESIKFPPFNLGIERDMYFGDVSLAEVMEKVKAGGSV